MALEMVDIGGLSGRPELARTLPVQEHTSRRSALQAEAEERAEQQHGVYSARMNNLATLNVDEIEKVSSSSGFDRAMEQVEKIKADIKAQAQRELSDARVKNQAVLSAMNAKLQGVNNELAQANVELAASKAAPAAAVGTAGAAPVFDPRLPAISVPSFDMDALAGGAAHAGKVAALEKRQEELQKELSAQKYTLYKLQSRGSVAQTEAGRLQRLVPSRRPCMTSNALCSAVMGHPLCSCSWQRRRRAGRNGRRPFRRRPSSTSSSSAL